MSHSIIHSFIHLLIHSRIQSLMLNALNDAFIDSCASELAPYSNSYPEYGTSSDTLDNESDLSDAYFKSSDSGCCICCLLLLQRYALIR